MGIIFFKNSVDLHKGIDINAVPPSMLRLEAIGAHQCPH